MRNRRSQRAAGGPASEEEASGREDGPTGGSADDPFVTEVFPEELAYVERRRVAAGAEPADKQAPDAEASSRAPSTAHRLIGLAFSGGGIRSATFNLGVLQTLHERGVFKHIDLLSTVSGGGFIGSCLTSLLSQGERFPFAGESAAVEHLRNNSNYLAPRGVLDYLRMFAVLIRGIILNWLVLVPILLVPCLVATLIYGPRLLNRLEYDETTELAERLLVTAVAADKGVEIAAGEPVAPLLELLKRRGFLPLHVAKEDTKVTRALREPDPQHRDVKGPLITGTGSAEAPYTFLPDVELSHIARRLVDAELLVPPQAIEEVQAVELALRRDLGRRAGAIEEDVGQFIAYLQKKRKSGEPHLPRPGDETGTSRLFMVFVGADTLVEVLSAAGMIEPSLSVGETEGCARLEYLDRCRFTLARATAGEAAPAVGPTQAAQYEPGPSGSGDVETPGEGAREYSLTQVLQLFYDERLLDRRKVEQYLRETGQTREVAYRWPDDQPTHLEVEAAALHLWEGLYPPLAAGPKSMPSTVGRPSKTAVAAPAKTATAGLTKARKSAPSKKAPATPVKGSSTTPVKGGAGKTPGSRVSSPIGVRAPRPSKAGGGVPAGYTKTATAVGGAAGSAKRAGATSAAADTLPVSELFSRLEALSKGKTAQALLEELSDRPPKLGRVEEAGRRTQELLAALRGAGLVVAEQPGKICDLNDLSACRLASAGSLRQLPRLLYKRHFYREEWFKARFFETRAAHRDAEDAGRFKRLVRATPLVGDWFDPRYRPLYRRTKTAISELELDAAARRIGSQLEFVRQVPAAIEGLLALSIDDGGPPLLLPSRTPAQREELAGRLRTALEQDYVIECKAKPIDSCSFMTKDAIGEIPYVLYDRQLYNRAWFERNLAVSAAAPGTDSITYRSEWAAGWRAHKEKILGPGVKAESVTVDQLRPHLRENEAAGRSLIKELSLAGLLLPRQPKCDSGGGRRTKAVDVELERRRAQSRGSASGELASVKFNRLRDCRFALDETVQWLYDNGRFAGEPRPIRDAEAVSKSFLETVADLYEHRVLPFVERQRWSPHDLHLPLTVRAVILGLVWVLLFPFVSRLIRIWRPDGENGQDLFERSFGLFMLAIAGVAFLELQPYLFYHWHYLDLGMDWSVLLGGVSVTATLAAGPALKLFKKVGRTVVLVVVSLLGPLLPFVVYLSAMNRIIYWESLPTRNGYELHLGYVVLIFLLGALGVHLFLLAVDPNSTGMHEFYKGRLSQAYLLAAEGGEVGRSIVPARDPKLSRICPDGSGAPYHLLNVALNIQGSDDPGVRDRRSDFFTFSRLFVGGPRTGYCRTEEMEAQAPHLSLGTAMAVSGAAAAPNMGSFTVGPLVILLALLNIRLGYWVPHPREVRRRAAKPVRQDRGRISWLKRLPGLLIGRFEVRPGPYVFLSELLSRIDDKGRNVNVSDGGHLENTGVLELLRRRCKLIIACDAEADPKMNLAGLAALQRFARIDLGIELELDTSKLRRFRQVRKGVSGGSSGRRQTDYAAAGGRGGAPRYSHGAQHLAVGRIVYPERRPGEGEGPEIGHLIYLKTSLTGDESQIVSEYHGRQPLFPHEATLDQFFDESQFEAYRDLGSHVVEMLYEELRRAEKDIDATTEEKEVLEWLNELGWPPRVEAAGEKA